MQTDSVNLTYPQGFRTDPFIFPPAVIGAVLCVYRAKKCQKGGEK